MDQTSPVPQTVWDRLADPALKLAFARFMASRPDSQQGRFEAAKLTLPNEPDNSFLIFQVMEYWPADVLVIAERERLARTTGTADLPTMEQTAREVYNLAVDQTKTVKERLEAYRLYGELTQMIGKASTTNNTVNNTYNDHRGVFIVPERVTDAGQAAFAIKAENQQARLVAANHAPAR